MPQTEIDGETDSSLQAPACLNLRTHASSSSLKHDGSLSVETRKLKELVKMEEYEEITYEQGLTLTNKKRGAHILIYAIDEETKLFDTYSVKATVMMQLRFDGTLGFPGGLIETGETVEEGLNREVHEEIGLDTTSDYIYNISRNNHVLTHTTGSCVLYFFVLKVSLAQFKLIERNAIKSRDFGTECLGSIHVPLYKMEDGGGLPKFLKNAFVGNAKEQLLRVLHREGLLTLCEIESALQL